jgi:hypothetical protein
MKVVVLTVVCARSASKESCEVWRGIGEQGERDGQAQKIIIGDPKLSTDLMGGDWLRFH